MNQHESQIYAPSNCFSPYNLSSSLVYQAHSPVNNPIQYQPYSHVAMNTPNYYFNTCAPNSYSFSNNSYLSNSTVSSDYNSNHSSDASYASSYKFYSATSSYKPYEASTPVQSVNTQVSKQTSRLNQLPERAVDAMNEYFNDHLNNPYPSQSEKENLARLGGISVKQVTAWFSNRRNRSQNTKPKRMKRVLEQEINNIFDQFIGDEINKQAIINKVRSKLVGQEMKSF